MALVKPSASVCWIGQTSCRSSWDWSNWSNILWQQAELDRFLVGGSRDWSNVSWEYLALAKLSMSVCGIGSGVKLPVGVDRIG